MKTVTLFVLFAAWAAAQEPAPEFEPLPRSRFPQLPGTCILLLVGNPNPVTMLDCRGGSPEALCISSDRSSYRWVWVPEPRAAGMRFRIPGAKDELVIFRDMGVATLKNTKTFGVTTGDCLVEAEINGGRGSAEGADSVALTRLKVLDGTPEYPIKVAEAVAVLRQQHEKKFADQAAEVEKLLETGRQASVRDQKATGPRETNTLTYLTWNTKENRLEVRFNTRISDGRYSHGGGAAPPPGTISSAVSGYEWAVELEMKGSVERSGKAADPVWGPLTPSLRFLPPVPSAPGPR